VTSTLSVAISQLNAIVLAVIVPTAKFKTVLGATLSTLAEVLVTLAVGIPDSLGLASIALTVHE